MFAAGLDGQWWILIVIAAVAVSRVFITRWRRNHDRD
jgi:hypothetical protein